MFTAIINLNYFHSLRLDLFLCVIKTLKHAALTAETNANNMYLYVQTSIK